MPLGEFCSNGILKINSLTDSTNTNCVNMNLAILSGNKFSANYPYPNLYCTVTFICGTSVSTEIIVSTYHYLNSWPWKTSNTFLISTFNFRFCFT